MATVSSSLKLFDSMSGPLKSITSSMNMVITTMQQMQKATDKNVNVDKSLIAAKKQIAAAEAAIKSSVDQATSSQNKFNRSLKEGKSQSSGLLSSIKAMAAAYLTIEGTKSLIGATMGGSMEQQKMKDMFIARTGNARIGTAMFDQFKRDALAAGQDVNKSLQGTLSFFSTTQNTDQLKQLNNLAQRMNAFDSAGNGIEGATFALKEAMSGDIVSLAERFNMSKTDIRAFDIDKLGKAGDMDGFIKAFDKLLEKQKMGQAAFDTMMASPVKQLETLGNKVRSKFADAGGAAVQALLPLITSINKAFGEKKFEPFFNALSTGLAGATSLVVGLANGAMWLGDVIKTYWPEIIAILAGIGTTIALLVIPKLWAMIPPLWAATTAVWAQATAWLAINWPILLIGLAVIGFILILQKMGVSFGEVIGFMVGWFMMFYGFIYNKVALIWNIFASFAEFLNNLFIDPIYAIQKLVYDLAVTFGGQMINMLRSAEDFAGGFMKTILSGINGVLKGFNWLSKKILDMTGMDVLGTADMFDVENINSMSDRMQSTIDQWEKPTSTKNVVNFGRMETKNLKDQFDSGYKTGSKFANSLDLSLPGTGKKDDFSAWNKAADAARKANGADDKKKKNIGTVDKIKGKVDISSEDLKVMRDLAEMKNIQNFVTLTPTVQVKTGPISNETNLDSIVSKITTHLQDSVASSAKGVFANG
ncbi:APC family permease [Paenibacillus macquariensis]|uniref:Uncharacterized protein n=1 Tax=Paenibacillus macquariensis TaxID=948756 RepID=A0ABY1JY24_9BACL|nr:hypothetical protein [Paenibacillus macquariensis]MEC0089327.1 hypothetical protein [Paenibacillus macquariensis]OAB33271.1 hypothetical protein PMSM_14760 [Paenibacillus macquariensis subsp. macquariensis]SIQ93753.1 hypothetical protein SAMN05421578_105131 [Paenibacillus macquariensis]